jgi:GTP diphosphokinase / guanosine-3',5'-bis(diphosphate) 3'-diphosphatase
MAIAKDSPTSTPVVQLDEPSPVAGVTAPPSPPDERLDLNEFERRLLGDLFAIVSEHAEDSAVEIDRDRVRDAFVFAC